MSGFKDRMVFDRTILKNGISVYGMPADVPFSYIWLSVPVGHIHNTGEILPGSAHFLEHLVCGRSDLYPEHGSFTREMELEGGDFGAETSASRTQYKIRVPAGIFPDAFRGLINHVSRPLIDDQGVDDEKGIIKSERGRKSVWYPATSELGHYCMKRWKATQVFQLSQTVGEDADIDRINPANLRQLHRHYFDPRTYVILGGNYDAEFVFRVLSALETKQHTLTEKFQKAQWANRTYHTASFPEVTRHIYRLGGFTERRNLATLVGMHFMGTLLTNTTHGALYRWLRDKLHWVYDVGFNCDPSGREEIIDWELVLPLTNPKHVDIIRRELRDQIEKAIENPTFVHAELRRRLAESIFWYQTTHEKLKEADGTIQLFGHLVTETEWRECIINCGHSAYLQKLYETYWTPSVTGEFLAWPTPKR